MSAVETVVQKAVRARLAGNADVIALVPAMAILDTHQRPAPSPSILMGEAMADWSVDQDIARRRCTVYLDLHIWKREVSTEGAKAIAGAIVLAFLDGTRLDFGPGFHCVDTFVEKARHLRDPGGEMSHSVVSLTVKAQRV